MAQKTLKPSEMAAIVGVIDPDANGTGTLTTGWIAAKDFASFMAIIQAGTLGASATLNAKLEQATNGAGAGAKDIDGAAITELVKATNDDDQAIVECFADDLDLAGGFTYLRLSMTVGTATCDCSAVVLGFGPRYAPASGHDLDSVVQIVAA